MGFTVLRCLWEGAKEREREKMKWGVFGID
jgi:hypothetical protein